MSKNFKSLFLTLFLVFVFVWVPGSICGESSTSYGNVVYAQEENGETDASPSEPSKIQLMKDPGLEYEMSFNFHTQGGTPDPDYTQITIAYSNGLTATVSEIGISTPITVNGVYDNIYFTVTLPSYYMVAHFDMYAQNVKDLSYNEDKTLLTGRIDGFPMYNGDQMIWVYLYHDEAPFDFAWPWFCDTPNTEWRLPAGSEDLLSQYYQYGDNYRPCAGENSYRLLGYSWANYTWHELVYILHNEKLSEEIRIQHYNYPQNASLNLTMASSIVITQTVGGEYGGFSLSLSSWNNGGSSSVPTKIFFQLSEEMVFNGVEFTDENNNELNFPCYEGELPHSYFCTTGLFGPIGSTDVNDIVFADVSVTPLVANPDVVIKAAFHATSGHDLQFSNNYWNLHTAFVEPPVVYNSYLPLIQVDGN